MDESVTAGAAELTAFVAELFGAAGLAAGPAARVASALVEADLSGRGSHGVLQADAYLEALSDGRMSRGAEPRLLSETGGSVVLDGGNIEGHLLAEEAMSVAVAKAREYGVSAIAVRRGNHCGVMGRYVRMAAEQGCVAFAMCNARPVMPAPGGAEPVAGTNPLAIAFPVAGGDPVVLDMATTAGTVGKIRQYLAEGRPLPDGWATGPDGIPTTDPATALKGFLLPAAGAKGFGLAFVIDMLAGLLSGGAWGSRLGGLRGDRPADTSMLFIALDIAHFGNLELFLDGARDGVGRLKDSRRAAGVARLYAPGERSAESLRQSSAVRIAPPVAAALRTWAERLGAALPDFLR